MDWFGILEACRKLSPNDESFFNVKDLNKKIQFSKTATRNPEQIASAWIGKFVKWGYAVRVGDEPNPGHKPLGRYTLTKDGREIEQKVNKLDEIRDLVRQFEGTRGTKKEAESWKNLISFCDKLDREEFGVE